MAQFCVWVCFFYGTVENITGKSHREKRGPEEKSGKGKGKKNGLQLSQIEAKPGTWSLSKSKSPQSTRGKESVAFLSQEENEVSDVCMCV
jgi:hypothetical protein